MLNLNPEMSHLTGSLANVVDRISKCTWAVTDGNNNLTPV